MTFSVIPKKKAKAFFMLFPLSACLLVGVSCGIMGPPIPREEVVPAPITKISMYPGGDKIKFEFKLPDESVGGNKLERVGGYCVVRKGPDGKTMKRKVFLSVSQQLQLIGKNVSFSEDKPVGPGMYQYKVIPMDSYGSQPYEGNKTMEFFVKGNQPEGVGPKEATEPEKKAKEKGQ